VYFIFVSLLRVEKKGEERRKTKAEELSGGRVG
jgi:hypothetical protein